MKNALFIYFLAAGIAVRATAETCSSCGGIGATGSQGADVGPELYVSMGAAQYGQSAGHLTFSSSVPDVTLFTPAGLQFTSPTRTDVTVITNSNGSLRQVYAPQALADIPVPSTTNGYLINFYFPSQVSSFVSGVYTLSGAPFTTWIITNTNSANINQIQISESNAAYGLIKQLSYNYSSGTGTWSVQSLGNLVQENMTITNLSTTVYQVTNSVQSPSGPIVQQAVNTYQTLNWSASTNVALIQSAVGSTAAPEITTYTYWDPATFSAGSMALPQFVTHPDGSWEYYSNYNSSGDPLIVYSAFGDFATNNYTSARKMVYSYDPGVVSGTGDVGTADPDMPRQTVESINGQIVSLSYTAFPSAAQRLDIQCLITNAAWNTSGNLVTTNYFYTNGPNQFALQSVIRPDGTMTTYNYLTNATASYRTNVTAIGQPDPTYNYIVDGTSNQTVVSQWGYPASSITWDIKSGIMISQDIYTNFDSYGRPQQVSHLDGTTEYTSYACCGIDSTTDRDGVVNDYDYDTDHRLVGHTMLYNAIAISYTNTLDAVGRTLQSIRVGSDSTSIIMSQSAFDTAGELISQTNALGGTNAYARSTNATTGGLIRTTTNPDGGTVINSYYADGTLKTTTGTATAGKAYSYGTGADANGNQCTFTIMTNLNANGTLSSQWTKMFTDMAGRTTETLYAAASGTPTALSYYNSLGQLNKQVDPDGVTTLFVYNPKGEQVDTVLDINQNGSIDLSGPDRITFVTNYATTAHSTNVLRTDTYVWDSNSNTSNLLSRSETSTSGLQQWSTIWSSGTPVTSSSQTVYSGVGGRSVTNTAPDSSYTISAFSYGRLASTTKYDSSGSQIGQTTNGYDAHGRNNTMTDARDGTTTLTFNNADQVNSLSTPSPTEVTTSYFDTSERLVGTQLPDGTYTTNLLNPTGQAWQMYGSREYPVGNAYDGQERMTTMTNWTSFLTGAGARVTTWNYDAYRGWLNSKVYDDGKGPVYSYTNSGRLAARLWARGTNTTYGYTGGGDLASVGYNDGVTPSIGNGYDRLGHKTLITNGATVCALIYNDASLLLSESYSGGPLSGITITNVYDSDMRRTSSTMLGAALNPAQNFTYDNASRLATASDGTNSATYSYLANSPLVGQITLKHGGTTEMTTTKGYDNLNRLTGVTNMNASSLVLDSHGYGYNSANQRTLMTNADGSYWVYGYDSLGQVISALKHWSDGKAAAGEQFGDSFDNIGNRINSQMGGNESGVGLRNANYTVNDLNQYTSRTVSGAADVIGSATNTATVTVNGILAYRHGTYYRAELPISNTGGPVWQSVTNTGVLGAATNTDATVTGNIYLPQNPEAFAYDNDGNLTNDGRFAYSWDAENRLTNMTSLSACPTGSKYKLDFAYDYLGRRVQKTVSTNNGSSYVASYTNRFVYDGWNLVAILNPDSTIQASFVWGSDLSGSVQGAGGVGGLISMTVSSGANAGTYFYCYDGNGNVSALLNPANNTIATQYEYGPFGEVIRATGPMAKANPFRFSTIYQDDETDMLMYLHRPYSASQGRFLSREPLGELGANLLYNIGVLDVFGEESRENPYLLVDNDPVHHYDILGLQSVPVSLAEAIAQGNVAQVESILAGMEEGDAGYAAGQAFLRKVATCEAIYAAYKALNCKGCAGCTTKESAIANAACLTAEIAGRALYLKNKCDYCLAGSIARGSSKAEAGHEIELANKTRALAKCTGAIATLPSATPPVVPPAP